MISAIGARGTAEWATPTLVPTGFPPSIAFGNAVGAPVAIPVPLIGFEQSYLGPPIDGNKYAEEREALMHSELMGQQSK